MHLIQLLLSLTFILQYISEPCIEPRLRKEIRELTLEERTRLLNAFKKLHERTEEQILDSELSDYEKLAQLHDSSSKFAHGRPVFFPWHRVFLRYTEMKLQKIDPNVTLAYWDWSLDSKKPHLSEIFMDDFLGSQGKFTLNGDDDKNWCMMSGIFANVTFNYPEEHCFRRQFDSIRPNTIDEFPSPEEILVAINEKKYSYFAHMFEAMHGYPHMNIGGGSSDFQTMYSPLDIIFYFHHTFIDYIWYQWQQKHPDLDIEDQYDGVRYRKRGDVDDLIKPFSLTVRDSLNTTSDFFCYRYDSYPRDIVRPIPKTLIINTNGNYTSINVNVTTSEPERLLRSITVPRAFFNPMLSKFKDLDVRTILESNKVKPHKEGGGRTSKPKEFSLSKLRPLSQAWIRKNNLNRDTVQEDKELIDNFKDVINDQKIFIPLALI